MFEAEASSTRGAEPCWNLRARSENRSLLPGRSLRQLLRFGEISSSDWIVLEAEVVLHESGDLALGAYAGATKATTWLEDVSVMLGAVRE